MRETIDDVLVRLGAALPDTTSPSDINTEARATLRYVVDAPESALHPVHPDPKTCPNCAIVVNSTRTPYCSENCREMAGFVRQFRTGLSLGWIFEEEKQVAMGQVLWHVLGGGRPLRRQIAPARARETALNREGRRCQCCGSEATTVDHIGSGCNRPINLRAVCEDCCEDRAFGDARVTGSEVFKSKVVEIAGRVRSASAIRVCDEAEAWNWREYVEGRKLII